MGDCNNDGTFNIADVILLQKWLLAVPNVTLPDWKAADLCNDDRLDVFDLCMMKRLLLNS
ncbi:MAG: dockerin type I repeat-containing protein [Ruminococcus sp.]|nr:dockerin type I repeat-containing protein [Ruminococcus sp.]